MLWRFLFFCSLLSFLFSYTPSCPKAHIFDKIYSEHILRLAYLHEQNPKLLVLFSGTPGMGKSEVATVLEEQFHGLRLSSDEIRSLLAKEGFPRLLVDRFLEWELIQLERFPNHLIILDRSCDRTFDAYAAFAKKREFDLFLVRMQVKKSQAQKRILARKRDASLLLSNFASSWRDFENFGKNHRFDFYFDNTRDRETPLAQLKIQLRHALLRKACFARLVEGSEEYEKTRKDIREGLGGPKGKISSYADEILPGLFLGNRLALDCLPEEISHVLSIRSHPSPCKKPCIWKGIALADDGKTSLLPFLDDALAFIDSTDTGILIHCRAGASRSASFVIAYIMKKFHVPYETAYAYVKSRHPITEPNSTFKKELVLFDQNLSRKKKSSTR
jgi:predicted kinase